MMNHYYDDTRLAETVELYKKFRQAELDENEVLFYQLHTEKCIQFFETNIASRLKKLKLPHKHLELHEYAIEFPEDMLLDVVKQALTIYDDIWNFRAACSAANPWFAVFWFNKLLISVDNFNGDLIKEAFQKDFSVKGRTVYKHNQEILYSKALDKIEEVAQINPSWNHVQLVEEVLKADEYRKLSPRELTKRVKIAHPTRTFKRTRKK